MTPYDVLELGKHWFGLSVEAWRQQGYPIWYHDHFIQVNELANMLK